MNLSCVKEEAQLPLSALLRRQCVWFQNTQMYFCRVRLIWTDSATTVFTWQLRLSEAMCLASAECTDLTYLEIQIMVAFKSAPTRKHQSKNVLSDVETGESSSPRFVKVMRNLLFITVARDSDTDRNTEKNIGLLFFVLFLTVEPRKNKWRQTRTFPPFLRLGTAFNYLTWLTFCYDNLNKHSSRCARSLW